MVPSGIGVKDRQSGCEAAVYRTKGALAGVGLAVAKAQAQN
jgi:hypothetical protein